MWAFILKGQTGRLISRSCLGQLLPTCRGGEGGEEQGRANLQEDSHGPAAAEPELPGPVRPRSSAEPQSARVLSPKERQLQVPFAPSLPPSRHPRILPPLSVALGPVKERHGSGERRPRQRGDVEEAGGRHQEDL